MDSIVSGLVYRLTFRSGPAGWAIGSTTQSLQERKDLYVKTAQEGYTTTELYQRIRISGASGFDLTELARHDSCTRSQLLEAEQLLINSEYNQHCLNTVPAYLPESHLRVRHLPITRYVQDIKKRKHAAVDELSKAAEPAPRMKRTQSSKSEFCLRL